MATEKVTMMICDNDDCGSRQEHSKDFPAAGYHLGRGVWVEGGGGPIPKTYACTLDCIGKAVEHNIERDNGQRD